jgi:hypothetical protein
MSYRYRRTRRSVPSQLRCLRGLALSVSGLAFLFVIAQLERLGCLPLLRLGGECTLALPAIFHIAPWLVIAGGLGYTIIRGYFDFFTDAYLRDRFDAEHH